VYTQKTDAQQLIWQRVVDTGTVDRAVGVVTDRQGNIIIVGTTVPGEIEPNDNGDILTIKYNPQGDTIWTRRFDNASDGNSSDRAFAVAMDAQDNIFVAGSIWHNFDGWPCCIVKYTSNGDLCWVKKLNNDTVTVTPISLVIDSKGNLVVTGRTNYLDYQTVKYDSNGSVLWMRIYDGGYEDYAQDITIDDSDNVIVTGYSDSNINWDWCTIKYSPKGDIIWVKRFDVSRDDWAHGVATDGEGNIIVCGEIHRGNGHTGVLVKYTPQGDTLWTKTFVDTLQFAEVGKFVDVTTDSRGNIYLVGDYARWDTSGKLWVDYYIAKCTPLGDTVWTTRCGAGWENRASGITLDRWSNIIVTGTKSPYPGGPSYEIDYQSMKIGNIIDAVYDERTHLKDFYLSQNYPNPFNPSTTIVYGVSKSGMVRLVVFDMLGRKVAELVNEFQSEGEHRAYFNGTTLPSGVYFARLDFEGKQFNRRLVLMK
jgi:hypothetical protein